MQSQTRYMAFITLNYFNTPAAWMVKYRPDLRNLFRKHESQATQCIDRLFHFGQGRINLFGDFLKLDAGIGIETNTFFTLYFLLTGFHFLHVIFGLILLAIVAVWDSIDNLETGAAYWHMVDLVWVLIFPIVYLVR